MKIIDGPRLTRCDRIKILFDYRAAGIILINLNLARGVINLAR